MKYIKPNCFIIEDDKQFTKDEYSKYVIQKKNKSKERELTNEDWFQIYKKGADEIVNLEKWTKFLNRYEPKKEVKENG